MMEFQSAPHFSSEANLHAERLSISTWRFNPRLTSAARRTPSSHPNARRLNVSIRASLQQRGEPSTSLYLPENRKFQSAPHFSSEANASASAPIATKSLFQSAPHFSSEANPIPATFIINSHAFQSAPHFSSEANPARGVNSVLTTAFQSAPHFSSEANRSRNSGRT